MKQSPELSTPSHGGNLDAIGLRYGVDPDDLLDFSANLNPLGPPPGLLTALAAAASDVRGLARYPDPDARGLRTALAERLDVEPEAIVIGNGAAALLSIVLIALRVRRCVVPVPAFSEDSHAVTAAGARWTCVSLDAARGFGLEPSRVVEMVRISGADACMLTNPHNPSGTLAERDVVLQLADDARARGAVTIVDEAFIDYAPKASVTRDASLRAGLVTVRSLTKIFAVPALRVGYAVAAPDLARKLHAAMPSWPITTLAERALTAALADRSYLRRTLAENAGTRSALSADLIMLGLMPIPSAGNFLLVALPSDAPRAAELVHRLILDARIVVRDCSSYEGLEAGRHIRTAVRTTAENALLVEALKRVLQTPAQ
jgi:threonine-phosphate decarboxylase